MAKYRFKTMGEEYNALTERIKNGEELNVFEQKYAVALGHAMDLSQFARNNGIKRVRLDFTIDTESKLDRALNLLGMSKKKEGLTEEECVNYLIDMCSYYQLFALCNYVEDFFDRKDIEEIFTVSIDYNKSMSENLVIKAKENDSDVEKLFDPKQALEDVADKCIFFADVPHLENVRGLAINLNKYREKVEQFLSEI